MFFSNLLLFLLILFILIFELTRKKEFVFDGLFLFHIWFILSYILSPFLINNFGSNFASPLFFVENRLGFGVSVAVIFVFYFSFILGYHLRINSKYNNKVITLIEKEGLREDYVIIVLIIIGAISMVVFINQYGGIRNVIENGNTIRNGQIERNTLGAFFNLLSVYVNYAVWIIFAYILLSRQKKIKIKQIIYFIFIVLFIISIGWGLIRSSRGGLLQIFLMIYLISVFINNKLYMKYITAFVFFSLFVLIYGKDFFYLLSLNFKDTFEQVISLHNNSDLVERVAKIMRNFAYPYMSLNMAMDIVGEELSVRWFMDIPYSVIFYFQLFGFDAPATITYLNTYYALGRYESNIPPGIIAFFWYSLKLPGVILGGVFFGYFLRLVNYLFYCLTLNKKPISIVFYLVVITKMAESIFYGDLRVFIIQSFSLILFLFLYLLFYTKIKIKRKEKTVHGRLEY